MAVSTVRDEHVLTVAETTPRSAPRVIASGILINLLNPKLTLFFFAFLPQFVTHQTHATLRMVELSGVFMLVTFLVFVGYGVLASMVRDQVLSRPRAMVWMRRAFGSAFAVLAGRLAFVER
jgi:threonine/homoserine/homoserine lactone efflux protein